MLAETKSREHGSDFCFNGIAIARLELVLQAMVTVRDLRVFDRFVRQFRHLPRQLLHLLFHLAEILEDRHALGENASAG